VEILMAWRNVWRNPRRTILTVLAIAFACLILIFMLSLQAGTYEVMIHTAVKTQTGHFQVTAENYNEDHKIRKAVAHPNQMTDFLDKMDRVKAFGFRANGFALISSDQRTCGGMITGIDPVREFQISSVPAAIRQGRFLLPEDTHAAVIGALLAKNLKIGVNDELVVLGSAMDGSIAAGVLEVKGIFSSGMDAYDRSGVQIPLAYFQEIFAMGESVHQVVGICDSLWSVEGVQAEISDWLPGLSSKYRLVCQSWDEIMPGLIQSIQMDLGGGIIFYGILMVVVAFSIMNTFLMAVFERTREFGTLLAMGTGPWRLSKMLIYESFFLTLCGIVLGITAGTLITLWAQVHGIPMGDAEGMLRQYGIPGMIRPSLSWFTALAGPVLVFFITMLTALYPVLKVHRLTPTTAMAA